MITEKENQTSEEPKEKDKKSGWKLLVKDIIIAVCLALLISVFIRPTIVKQTSMEDTVMPSDYLITARQAYLFSEPERGDIIIFQSDMDAADGESKNLIKRVIGLPGETVTIRDGSVYINGEAIEEPYVKGGYTTGSVEGLKIDDGEYFVMGDNREVSLDSRDFGPISEDSIKGKAVLRLYPFDEIRTFKGVDYE